METHSVMTGFILFAGFVMMLFIMAFIFIEIGKKVIEEEKRKEREFFIKYSLTENIVDNAEVCEQNYQWIERMIDKLRALKYNKEKVRVLYDRFTLKYESIKRYNEAS